MDHRRYLALFTHDQMHTPSKHNGLGLPDFEHQVTASCAKWIYDILANAWPSWKITFLALNDLPKGLHTFISHSSILNRSILSLSPRWRTNFVAFLKTQPPISMPQSTQDVLLEYIAFNRFITCPNTPKFCSLTQAFWNTPIGLTSNERFIYNLGLQIRDLVLMNPDGSYSGQPRANRKACFWEKLASRDTAGRDKAQARSRHGQQGP
jgi:hypothetical protein